MIVRSNGFLKFVSKLAGFEVWGITLFPFVIVNDAAFEKKEVLNHEQIHIRQQAETLIIFFFLIYGIIFLVNLIKYKSKLQAYLYIPFEKEAYQNSQNLNYLKTRKFWHWIKY